MGSSQVFACQGFALPHRQSWSCVIHARSGTSSYAIATSLQLPCKFVVLLLKNPCFAHCTAPLALWDVALWDMELGALQFAACLHDGLRWHPDGQPSCRPGALQASHATHHAPVPVLLWPPGESIIVAPDRQGPFSARSLARLVTEPPAPIASCLVEQKRGMKRALLEVSHRQHVTCSVKPAPARSCSMMSFV